MPPEQKESQCKHLLLLRNIGVVLLGLGLLLNMFFQTSFSVMADRLMGDFSINAVQLASLGSVFFYVYSIMQLPSGVLADAFGPRQVVSSGLATAGVGAFLLASSGQMITAYLGRALIGLGMSLIYVSTLRYVANWWPANQYSTVNGIVAALGNLGAILATTPLAWLVITIGWRRTHTLLAYVAFLLAAGCYLLVRNTPQEACRVPQPKAAAPPSKRGLNALSLVPSLQVMLRVRPLVPICISLIGLRGSQMAFLGVWSVPYLMQAYGFTRTEAASYVFLINLGRIVGFPLVGAISDRIGNARYPYVCGNLAYLAIWLYFIVFARIQPSTAVLMFIYFLLGVMGATSVLAFSLVQQSTPSQVTGMALGFVNGFGIFGTTLFQLAVGFILDRHWEGATADGTRIYSLAAYQRAFVLFLVMLACTTICTLLIKDEGTKIDRDKRRFRFLGYTFRPRRSKSEYDWPLAQ